MMIDATDTNIAGRLPPYLCKGGSGVEGRGDPCGRPGGGVMAFSDNICCWGITFSHPSFAVKVMVIGGLFKTSFLAKMMCFLVLRLYDQSGYREPEEA